MSKSKSMKRSSSVIKLAVRTLQRSFSWSGRANGKFVPQDVKEGHFAVMAINDEEPNRRRFVVSLSCLSHPLFLRLLEFAIPCKASELERIIERSEKLRGGRHCS